MGVTTPKKTIPITIGETIPPRNIPNLNQSLFKGDKIKEFNKPRTKKVIDTWNYEWNRYPGQRPSISAKAPASSEESGDVGICNICTGPYVDGACTTYKCWK